MHPENIMYLYTTVKRRAVLFATPKLPTTISSQQQLKRDRPIFQGEEAESIEYFVSSPNNVSYNFYLSLTLLF